MCFELSLPQVSLSSILSDVVLLAHLEYCYIKILLILHIQDQILDIIDNQMVPVLT